MTPPRRNLLDALGVELPDDLTPSQEIKVTATKDDGSTVEFTTVSRLDSKMDVEYYRHGGILQRVLRDFLKGAA